MIVLNESTVVWLCEKGHVDDFHMSIEGAEERCSRCGGKTVESSLAALYSRADQAERLLDMAVEAGNRMVSEMPRCNSWVLGCPACAATHNWRETVAAIDKARA